jgi:hypothetical protein
MRIAIVNGLNLIAKTRNMISQKEKRYSRKLVRTVSMGRS